MPFWYALCLILLGMVAFLHRAQDRSYLLVTAAVIWAVIIVYTIVVLVPINKSIAATTGGESWVEAGLLLAALLCLLTGLGV